MSSSASDVVYKRRRADELPRNDNVSFYLMANDVVLECRSQSKQDIMAALHALAYAQTARQEVAWHVREMEQSWPDALAELGRTCAARYPQFGWLARSSRGEPTECIADRVPDAMSTSVPEPAYVPAEFLNIESKLVQEAGKTIRLAIKPTTEQVAPCIHPIIKRAPRPFSAISDFLASMDDPLSLAQQTCVYAQTLEIVTLATLVARGSSSQWRPRQFSLRHGSSVAFGSDKDGWVSKFSVDPSAPGATAADIRQWVVAEEADMGKADPA